MNKLSFSDTFIAGKKKARTYAAPKPPKEDGGDDQVNLKTN